MAVFATGITAAQGFCRFCRQSWHSVHGIIRHASDHVVAADVVDTVHVVLEVPNERSVRGARVLTRHEQRDAQRVGHDADGYRLPREVGQPLVGFR